jgi:hypothetical protein
MDKSQKYTITTREYSYSRKRNVMTATRTRAPSDEAFARSAASDRCEAMRRGRYRSKARKETPQTTRMGSSINR